MARSLTQAQPQCAECQYLDAKAARRIGDYRHATQALERATGLHWDAADVARERVLAIVQTGQVTAYESELNGIFASDLDRAETEEVYEALANGHLAAFNGPELQRCLDYWLEWNPQATQPRLMRAQFSQRLAKYSEAAKQFEEIVRDHPACRAARLGWGECLLQLNQASAAETQLRTCLEQQRDSQTAVLLAKSLIQTSQSPAAGALLTEFQATPNPEARAVVLEELGRWNLDQGQADEAVKHLEEAVKLAPETASAWHALSSAYSLQGHPEKAKNALETSQASQKRLQRFAEVIVDLNVNPRSLPLRVEAAQILFQQGLDHDAVAWLNTVLSQDIDHRQANEILADYYTKQGQLDLAERHRQLAGNSEATAP